MKTDSRHHMNWAVRLRMLARLLGITAVLVAGAGAIYASSLLPDWKPDTLAKAARSELGQPALIAVALLLGGFLVVLCAIIVEILSALSGGSGRRGAAGVTSIFQVALAIAVVAAVNVYAFLHPASFDVTSRKLFTLPTSVVDELQKLKSETTIVVLQQHKTFGQLSAKPDRYDYAAERKVVEKVQDTVELFRKFGPQFKVVVLDVEEEQFKKKFDEVTLNRPALRAAINAAPENSIFFFSEGKVQRMSFNEFYQLDKHASQDDNGKKGNLVLQPQGIENLVRRITAIEEKRPKVAVAVTHPLLSTQKKKGSGADDFTLAGLKKSLNDYGIDVVDVVLKKNYRGDFEGDPASYTSQENRLNELEAKLETTKKQVKTEKQWGARLERNLQKLDEARQKPLADRIDMYVAAFGEMRRQKLIVTAEGRANEAVQREFESFILREFDFWKKEHQQDLAEAEEDLKQVEKELGETSAQERLIEDRNLSDVKAKFSRLLSDCDMLIIPRMTIVNAATGYVLPRNLHKLDKSQADVIKQFMKSGKPVLVCAGPANVPFEGLLPPSFDDVEALLGERGIVLGKQTILYNVETKSFRESSSEEDELADTSVEVPPLRFLPPDEWKPGKLKQNPIARAMAVLANSIDQPLDISTRAPRPVTVTDSAQKKQPFDAEFLWTSVRSWNESYPFNFMFKMQMNPFNMQPQRTRVRMPPPRYDASNDDGKNPAGPKDNDERRGPFSIAVAVESSVPSAWYDKKDKMPVDLPSSRIVVIGHGSIFNRPELSPAAEELLLVTCNWLLKREERMPHDADDNSENAIDRPWKYPRVEMTEGTKNLWHWGTFLGLPALFVYLGLIVLMIRRVR